MRNFLLVPGRSISASSAAGCTFLGELEGLYFYLHPFQNHLVPSEDAFVRDVLFFFLAVIVVSVLDIPVRIVLRPHYAPKGWSDQIDVVVDYIFLTGRLEVSCFGDDDGGKLGGNVGPFDSLAVWDGVCDSVFR